jgi:hypothetical protein
VNEVNRALAALKKSNDNLLGKFTISQFYVDEVQDLTMAQIKPLITLCSEPRHGLMFAGDTAQVISRGSAFRFEDLSFMVHQELNQSGLKEAKPEIFPMSKNCRLIFIFKAFCLFIFYFYHRSIP